MKDAVTARVKMMYIDYTTLKRGCRISGGIKMKKPPKSFGNRGLFRFNFGSGGWI
jgi:hypothetical protein